MEAWDRELIRLGLWRSVFTEQGVTVQAYSFRIPVAEEYVIALGRATYNFAYLEWGIVWIGQALKPGFINDVSEWTAGKIGKKIETIIAASCGHRLFQELSTLSAKFSQLVKRRDSLMHGNPYTAEGGTQQLLYNGRHGRQEWRVQDILNVAREFEDAAIEASRLLHEGGLLVGTSQTS
jgi:hypothetical protein